MVSWPGADWIAPCVSILAVEDIAKRVLDAYERFGSDPELTRELAGKIINEYFDEILILAGLGDTLKG
jgi:hypothetical protein